MRGRGIHALALLALFAPTASCRTEPRGSDKPSEEAMAAFDRRSVERHLRYSDPDRPEHDPALDGLVRMGGAAVPGLIDALKDRGDARRRVMAAKALGRIGDDRGIDPLGRAARNLDDETAVREAAVEALDRFDGAKPVAALSGAMQDPDRTVGWSAARALARRPGGAAICLAAAEGATVDGRANAIAGLQAIAAQKERPEAAAALAALRARLKDPAPPVRALAARRAGELKDRASAAPLIDLLSDPDPQVRAASRRALSQLAEQDLGPEPAPWRARFGG